MVNANQLADLELWIKDFIAFVTYKPTSAIFDPNYRVASVVCMAVHPNYSVVCMAVHFSSGAHFGNSVSIMYPEIDSLYEA